MADQENELSSRINNIEERLTRIEKLHLRQKYRRNLFLVLLVIYLLAMIVLMPKLIETYSTI